MYNMHIAQSPEEKTDVATDALLLEFCYAFCGNMQRQRLPVIVTMCFSFIS